MLVAIKTTSKPSNRASLAVPIAFAVLPSDSSAEELGRVAPALDAPVFGAPYAGDVAIVLGAPAVAGGDRSRLPVRGRHVLDVLLYRGGTGLSGWLRAGDGHGQQRGGQADADCDHQKE